MRCPYCSFTETKVSDKRDAEGAVVIRRRRECLRCSRRFTTYERAELPELMVIKKDGRREPFVRDKLVLGLMKAFEKRPVGLAEIEALADEIEMELRRLGMQEVVSHEIGNSVMKQLKKKDPIAYLRFVSVYRAFSDLKAFEKEVRRLAKT